MLRGLFKACTCAVASLSVKNLGAFKAATDKWLADARQAAEEARVGLAKRVFEKILYISPMYSGDFVANWKVFYGSPKYEFEADLFDGKKYVSPDPFKRGDLTAIHYAQHNANWAAVPLDTAIYLTNAAVHKDDEGNEEEYGWMIEAGTIRLRPVNAGAVHVMARAKKEMANRYAHITPSELKTLRIF